jgi:hypothetical protein
MRFTENVFSILVRAAANSAAPPPLVRKLRAFRALPKGWSHGEGIPVSPAAIRLAESFVDIATRLQLQADVFPGLNGDCAVTFYRDDKSVEVVVDAQRHDRFGLHVEEGTGFRFRTVLEKREASSDEVVKQITQLLPEAWKSHVSSHSISSTQSDCDFRTLSSSTPQEWRLAPLTGS